MATLKNNRNLKNIYIKLAFQQAKINLGSTGTNPSVGCIVEKNGSVISTGHTSIGGRPHAEFNALNKNLNFQGSSIYSTLEPCSHFGKTAPCINKIIEKKCKKVFFSLIDPDKRSRNQAKKKLKEKKIIATSGYLKSYAIDFYKSYFLNKIDKKNYIDAKIAISKDYYTKDKKNKYITNYLSRRRVHFLRSMYDCIISTSKSINDDNSILDCRIEGLEHKSPDLIIIDRKLKLKKNLKLFNKKIKRKIYLVTTSDKKEKLLFFRKKGLKIIKLKSLNNYKDYLFFFTYLNKLGFSRIFIETGLSFLNFLINNKLINNMYIFQSNDKIKRFGINYNSIYLIKKMKLKNKINVNLFNNKLYKVNLK